MWVGMFAFFMLSVSILCTHSTGGHFLGADQLHQKPTIKFLVYISIYTYGMPCPGADIISTYKAVGPVNTGIYPLLVEKIKYRRY